MKAMIFAAGLGTRLKPLTDTMPKALVPLAGKPLLQWQVEKLRDAGITDIIVNVHHFPDQIIEAVRANAGWGCNITISDEREALLDTGGGLRKAVKSGMWKVESEPILACNVDILSNIDIRLLVARYEQTGVSQLVVSERATQRYLCFDEQNQLCGWTNIATGEIKGKDGRHLAFSGMQILRPEVLARLDEMEQEKFSLIPFYLRIMNKVQLQAYIPSDYRMMDVGKIDQIAEAERFAESL
jgi:Nucleoside-diphosphate-sugar pyrophosphorylase involved in lipopolysaccharide biosynthesis/translation initiation factor 2B, gamma/epsilon subunits (eIF-2Bgamma/eIF-2Bepsilon)